MTAPLPAPLTLPQLRPELRLQPGAPLANGAPSWTLFDPLRHLFYKLGEAEFRLVHGWASGAMADAVEGLQQRGWSQPAIDRALSDTVEFALTNQLTVAPMGDATAQLDALRRQRQRSWWRMLLDNYLFFRVPLVRPAAFLQRTLPRVQPLFSTAALVTLITLALINLFFVARQFDAFWATFLDFLSLEGLIAYAIGLSVVKIVHELGHAYVATRYGCRVPTMGVAFLLMWPVLYTDTTGAWALRSRRQRLAIDMAGVSAELVVAVLATSAWLLLPDGALRSTAFVLATSSWVLSIGVNINPFMRFDGYYVLSDWLDVPNLQPRAFALMGWQLRRWLFALPDAPPERLPARLHWGLVAYAAMAALYRLFLFGGIALILYLTLFKPLGLILAGIEIGVFVVRPVVMEMGRWWQRRADIRAAGRGRWWLAGLGGALFLAALPLDRSVSAPAVLAPADMQAIVAGAPARIIRIHAREGDRVRSGQPIVELEAPELGQAGSQHRARIAALEERLNRGAASDVDLAEREVIASELAAERAALAGLTSRAERLVIRAAFDGVLISWGREYHAGRWVSGQELLGQIARPGRFDIIAVVAEDDRRRLAPQARARFIPDDALSPSRRARVSEVGNAAIQQLDQPLLASINGGAVAVRQESDGRLRPEQTLYPVTLEVPIDGGEHAALRTQTGEVAISASGESLLARGLAAVLRLFRSEASLF